MKDGRPKCPLCGATHYQREPHIWPDDPKVVVNTAPVVVNKVVNKPAVVVNTVVDKKTSRHGKYKDAAARKKYQAEGMKKKRATPPSHP